MESIVEEINRLKAERNAVILAHNYVNPEIQDIADFLGDSLELSFRAKESGAAVIVFCGVRFMAETAKLLSPESTVLIPIPEAGCAMADMVNAKMIQAYKKDHPEAFFVAYVNKQIIHFFEIFAILFSRITYRRYCHKTFYL